MLSHDQKSDRTLCGQETKRSRYFQQLTDFKQDLNNVLSNENGGRQLHHKNMPGFADVCNK